MSQRPVPDPDTATYYRVQMASGWAFNLTQAEGEQLCAKLESLRKGPGCDLFVRVEDLSGADQVISVDWIHGVYFSSPEQRAFDKQWNAQIEEKKDWSETE